jgi:outer membrane lipopolysaccharide assembly protein LptE/RlpB
MSRIKLSGLLLATVLVACLSGGCGYTLQGNLPGDLKTVSVPVFKNRTTEPGAESTITSAVVNAFTSNGRLRVVALDKADSILEGEIIGYQIQSTAVDRSINVREYRLVVTVNIQFKDVRKGEMLFRQEAVQERADFRVPGQVAETISSEEGAVREAAVDIGRRIVNLVVDRF